VQPSLLLCVQGVAQVHCAGGPGDEQARGRWEDGDRTPGDERVELGPGAAAFVSAGSSLRLQGPAVLFRATIGELVSQEAQ